MHQHRQDPQPVTHERLWPVRPAGSSVESPNAYEGVIDSFSWKPCGFNTTLGPCSAIGAGIGGRCYSHGGAYVPGWVGPLILAAQLRTDFDEAIPLGPARVFALPQKLWTELAPDDEWPQHLLDPERRSDGHRKRVLGRRQPIALEPGRGRWPQVISGDIARRLLRRGAVSRVIASTGLDAWWLGELLPGACIALRHPDTSDPALAAELETGARADYSRALRAGWASWS